MAEDRHASHVSKGLLEQKDLLIFSSFFLHTLGAECSSFKGRFMVLLVCCVVFEIVL